MADIDGYAIISDGEINIRTVSPTIEGAVVNWLATEGGVLCYSNMAPEEIREIWLRKRGTARWVSVQVSAGNVREMR